MLNTRGFLLLQPHCNLAKAARTRQLTWRCFSRGVGWAGGGGGGGGGGRDDPPMWFVRTHLPLFVPPFVHSCLPRSYSPAPVFARRCSFVPAVVRARRCRLSLSSVVVITVPSFVPPLVRTHLLVRASLLFMPPPVCSCLPSFVHASPRLFMPPLVRTHLPLRSPAVVRARRCRLLLSSVVRPRPCHLSSSLPVCFLALPMLCSCCGCRRRRSSCSCCLAFVLASLVPT